MQISILAIDVIMHRPLHYLYFVIFILCCSIIVPRPASALMSIEKERELGDRLLLMVKSRTTLVEDPEIVGYVTDIGHKILRHVNGKFFHYRFFVIQDDSMNAFAMPGGLVFIHTGLLENVDSEDELLCVMAHEIGHVQGRHVVRRIEQAKRLNIATAALAVAGFFLGGARGESSSAALFASSALNASIALKYSREDEEEADRRAYQWICKAGYDPRGLIYILKKMQRYRWLGSDTIPSYLATHPVSSERMTYLQNLWNQDPCIQKAKEDLFRLRKIQVKARTLTEDPQVLIQRYTQELKATPNDVFILYGLVHSLLAAQEYNEAIKIANRLVSVAKDRPEFKIDQGQAYLAAGKYRQAISIIEPYYKRHPWNLEAKFFLARAYLDQGNAPGALPLLKSLEKSWPDPTPIYLQMGRCLSALNRQGEAHYYLSRYYDAIGNQQAASYHHKEALKLLPRDSRLYHKLKKTTESKKGDKT